MIELLEVQKQLVSLTEAYVTNDWSALTISNVLSDDEDDAKYQCCEFSENGVAMIAKNGIWTEFEVMMPRSVENPMCQISQNAEKASGFPLLRFDGLQDDVYVQNAADYFTLWFSQNEEIDTVVENSGAQFYFSRKRLVGISTPVIESAN